MPRSLKQKWTFERLFWHAGTLAGIEIRLRQVARAHSTLPSEEQLLLEAAELVRSFSVRENKELSWEQFKRCHEGD